ncbi:MAG: hypothetical protein WDW36_009102 [Sanguina aurantia]
MASSLWNMRCRGPTGLVNLSGVDPGMSVHAFQQHLSSMAGAPDPELQELLAGFPPKVIVMPEDRHTASLNSLQIQNGDTITIRQLAGAAARAPPPCKPMGLRLWCSPLLHCCQLRGNSHQRRLQQQQQGHSSRRRQRRSRRWVRTKGSSSEGGLRLRGEYDEDAALAQALAMSMTEQEETAEKGRNAQQQEQQRQTELQEQQQLHRQKMQNQHAQQAQAHHQQQQAHHQQQQEQQRQQQEQQQQEQQRQQQEQQRKQQAAAPGSSHVRNGNGSSGISKAAVPAGHNQAAPVSMRLADGSHVIRRIIDSDNSCLFNAVGYVMEHTRSRAAALRGVIADAVSADPDTYNEGVLAKPNVEYCQWITQKDKWGGAIELSILAAHYGRQIAAYDIQTMRCDVYGQDAGYTEQVMLLYDGLHYDALAVSAFEGAPETFDVTIFEPESTLGRAIAAGAQALVAAAHGARQFTNTHSFTLRCGACQIGLKGEAEAVEHAKSTGHTNFAEY